MQHMETGTLTCPATVQGYGPGVKQYFVFF